MYLLRLADMREETISYLQFSSLGFGFSFFAYSAVLTPLPPYDDPRDQIP